MTTYVKINKAIAKLANTNKATQKAYLQAIEYAGLYTKAEVMSSIAGKRAEPRSWDTGFFHATIDVVPVLAGYGMLIYSYAPYAAYMEYGTSAHFVSPVSAKALSWTDKGHFYGAGIKRYFSKGHMVSGIQPRRHFRNSAKRVRKPVMQYVENKVRIAARKYGRS